VKITRNAILLFADRDMPCLCQSFRDFIVGVIDGPLLTLCYDVSTKDKTEVIRDRCNFVPMNIFNNYCRTGKIFTTEC